jgi:hypothetical protein
MDDTAWEVVEKSQIVGRHNDGGMLFVANLIEKTHYALSCLGVEIASRLVGENETGTIEKSPCDYDTLLLTTRKGVGHSFFTTNHIDEIEHFGNSATTVIGVFPTCGTKDKVKIGFDTAVGKQLKVLEDDADLTTKVGYLTRLECKEIVFVENTGLVTLEDVEILVHSPKK